MSLGNKIKRDSGAGLDMFNMPTINGMQPINTPTTATTPTGNTNFATTATANITQGPQYGAAYKSYYDGVNKFNTHVASKPVDFDTYTKNPAGYKNAGSSSKYLFDKTINGVGDSGPFNYLDAMTKLDNRENYGLDTVGMARTRGQNYIAPSDDAKFMGSTFGKTLQSSQLNQQHQEYDDYTKSYDRADTVGRSNALVGSLQSANPNINIGVYKDYWNDGGKGQQSVHDRMPTLNGINYADEYLKGTTPDAFSAAHPDQTITSTGGSGAGLTTGFSGDANSGSSFSSGNQSNTGGTQPMDNSNIIKGPAYATGGQIGSAPMGQMPQQAGLAPQGQQPQVSPQMLDANVQDMLQRNPQVAQKIKQVVDQAIQSGELTMQEAHMVVQLAQACINNNALWPQLRAFAVQQGLAGPNDLPQQYDQGLVSIILAAAKSYDHSNGNAAQVVPTQEGIPQQGQKQAFATGGQIQGKGTGTSDSIPAVNSSTGQHIKVSNGEFIIPAHVVAAKGTDFFEGLINKYNSEGNGNG